MNLMIVDESCESWSTAVLFIINVSDTEFSSFFVMTLWFEKNTFALKFTSSPTTEPAELRHVYVKLEKQFW